MKRREKRKRRREKRVVKARRRAERRPTTSVHEQQSISCQDNAKRGWIILCIPYQTTRFYFFLYAMRHRLNASSKTAYRKYDSPCIPWSSDTSRNRGSTRIRVILRKHRGDLSERRETSLDTSGEYCDNTEFPMDSGASLSHDYLLRFIV